MHGKKNVKKEGEKKGPDDFVSCVFQYLNSYMRHIQSHERLDMLILLKTARRRTYKFTRQLLLQKADQRSKIF